MKNILIKGLFVAVSVLLVTTSAYAMTCTNLTKALSKGSENSEVLKLQQFLFDAGYLTAKPNGYFGGGTMTAVKKFQGANGLSQVGSIGPGTRNKIKELSCGNGGISSNSISKVSVKCVDLQQELDLGSQGDEVTQLQQFLYDKKYLANKPNGDFDSYTMFAVSKFKSDNSISEEKGTATI